MARVTDTRQRVRELAGQLASQGIEPTPSLIRSFLGKGSPNTVVDELRRWKEEQSGPPPQVALALAGSRVVSELPVAPGVVSPPPASSPGAPLLDRAVLQEMAEMVSRANQLAGRQAETLSRLTALESLLEKSLTAQAQLGGQLSGALERFRVSEEAHASQLVQMETRYDAVQKYMLKSIEDAREEARTWKERAKNAQADLSTWRGVMERKVETLTAENSSLKSQLAAATGSHH